MLAANLAKMFILVIKQLFRPVTNKLIQTIDVNCQHPKHIGTSTFGVKSSVRERNELLR